MYKSKHDPKKKIPFSELSNKGPALGFDRCDKKPAQFLRARSAKGKSKPNLAPIEGVKKYAYPKVTGAKKAPLPKKGERPIMGLKTEKNFITANAVDSILRVPSLPVEQGPDYINKPDYGKVPDYLSSVKAEIKQENELIDNFVQSQMAGYTDAPEMCVEMDDGERVELIQKLKTKWDAVNKKYQVLTMHTKFEGHRKAAKENFEIELNNIEADLSKLTMNGPVMVSHD